MPDGDLEFYHRPLSPEPSFSVTKAMLRNAGIGRSYWPVSVQRVPDTCSHKVKLISMISNLPRDERNGKGAVFVGNHGYGKTSVASIMLKAAMARGGQCYHRLASSIEHAYEKRWTETNSDGIEIWEVLTRSQLLTIDDLGTELASGGYKAGDIRIIEELIRRRYDDRLVTYITTNLPVPELIKQYPSVSSILVDPSRFYSISVRGFNWRKGNDPEQES